MEPEAHGDTGFERDDNETFRGGCKSGVCLGYGFSLVVGGFLLETRDLGDRDSEVS